MELRGEFRLRLSIYLRDTGLAAARPVEEVVRQLATTWSARCLVSDGDINPFTMKLVTANETRRVVLDPEKLDQRDEYRLARSEDE